MSFPNCHALTENALHSGFAGLGKYGFVHLGEILKWEIEIQESKEFWECSAGKPSIEDEFIEIVGNRTFGKLGKPFSMPSDIFPTKEIL